MATIEQEVNKLVASIEDKDKREEAANILLNEAYGWASWYEEFSEESASQSEARLTAGEFVEDAALIRDWFQVGAGLKGRTSFLSNVYKNHSALAGAVSELITSDFSAGHEPKGADRTDALVAVLQRLLNWNVWYQRLLDEQDSQTSDDDYWVSY